MFVLLRTSQRESVAFFTAGGSIAHKMQSAESGTLNSIMSWTVKNNPFCLIYVFISTVFLLSSDDKWHKFFANF